MKTFFKISLIILLTAPTFFNANAQVGIGTISPDTSVILDIQSVNKGVLLPRPADFLSIQKKDGALFYDGSSHKIKFVCNDSVLDVNPLTTDTHNNVIAPGTMVIKGKSLYAPGADSISARMAIVKAKSFEGYGVVPVGGIIMWSGDVSLLPDNWALCDGTNHTPDLRGRFIVGYAKTISTSTQDIAYAENINNAVIADYASLGSPNGFKETVLDVTQMPSHSHDVIDYGHNHAITGEAMQKEGTSTIDVVAIDTQNDPSHGNVTFSNKIGNSKTGITLRKSGGIYTYQDVPNSNYITGCTVWQYTCVTTSGTSFQSSYALSAGQPFDSKTGSESLTWAPGNVGYGICVAGSNYSYCGFGFSDTDIGTNFKVTGCTPNAGYDPLHSNCIPSYYDPKVPLGDMVRINESWSGPKPIDNRPPYYVMAFIMRVK